LLDPFTQHSETSRRVARKKIAGKPHKITPLKQSCVRTLQLETINQSQSKQRKKITLAIRFRIGIMGTSKANRPST
jgi:hypothetical protein